MRLIHLSLLKFFIICVAANHTICSQIILDTVRYEQVGPGMYYSKYLVHSIPWSINVFEADMTNKHFSIETIKAFNLLAGGRERTSSMSRRQSMPGHVTICAVNGDFFDLKTGMPNNIQVKNGEVLRNERPERPAFGISSNNQISLSEPQFTGYIILRDSSFVTDKINSDRDGNELIFYNKYFGVSTNSNEDGFEAILYPIASWLANDTVYCIVDSINHNGGDTVIPDGAMVISAGGAEANYLRLKITPHDTIKIFLNLKYSVSKLKEMIGGYPIIVNDGIAVSMNSNDAFVFTRHPRTALGINRDSTKIFFVTVDGRQSSSLGMNLYELADFMVQIGIYSGLNLDGGGSTTMVIKNEIVNSPSDITGERPVSNAISVICQLNADN